MITTCQCICIAQTRLTSLNCARNDDHVGLCDLSLIQAWLMLHDGVKQYTIQQKYNTLLSQSVHPMPNSQQSVVFAAV